MQNIDVRFNATSNFAQVKGDLAALQTQAAALSSVLTNSARRPGMVTDAAQWRNATRGVMEASRSYRDAAASSGLFNTQQIRATSEAERYTKALQKQKLTMGEMLKHRGIMRQVYQDQLRYQRMTAQYWGTDSAGRAVTDIAIPRGVPRELDSMGQKMRFFSDMTKSAGMQMINLGKNIQWAGRQLMVGFTYPLILFGAGAAAAAYQVEDAFGQINKVYDVSAAAQKNEALRTKELNELRADSLEAAREVAERYGITVEKTLGVEQALAAAGLTSRTGLLEMTKEVQRISMLGDIDPEQTTDMVIALQTAFKMGSREVTETLNFMNAASNVTSLSLQDIAEATPRAASGLAQLGVTAEEMTILLVSMREAGVNAAEGANALKSATTRILNESILKRATDLFKKFGASINVGKISEEAGGNLFKFIKILGEAMNKTEELTAKEKGSAMGALFGTYQFNRLNAALVNVGDAYAGVNNQTAKAIELQKQSTQELTNMAKTSEELVTESPAAKFRKAWARFHSELAEMGKPFLEAATMVLNKLTGLAEAFNGMDDGKKKLVLLAAILLGMAGPVIMLTGLFLNLWGQVVKGIGNASGMLSRFLGARKLVTKEEQAAILTAEAQNKALLTTTQTTSNLVKEIQVLTSAYREATVAARSYAETQGVVGKTQAGGHRMIGPQLPPVRHIPKHYAGTEAQAIRAAQTAEMHRIRQQDIMNSKAAQEARIRQSVKDKINGGTVGITLASAAMGGMLLTNNEFVNSLSKWVLIGTLVLPAVIALANTIGVAAKNAWNMAAGTAATATGANAASLGFRGTMAAGAKGFVAGLGAIMGPVGWAITGVAALGAGWYALHKSVEKTREEHQAMLRAQDELQARVLSLTERWADATGRAYENYKKFNQQGAIDMTRRQQTKYDEIVASYETSSEEGGFKDEVDAFGNLSDVEQKYNLYVKMSEFVHNMGMNAKQARTHMAAFLDAVGYGTVEAKNKAEELFRLFKEQGGTNWFALSKDARSLADSYAVDPAKLKVAGEQAGTFFAQGFAKTSNPAKAGQELWEFTNSSFEDWLRNFNQVEQAVREELEKSTAFIGMSVEEQNTYIESLIGNAETFRRDWFDLSGGDFESKYGGLLSSDEVDMMMRLAQSAEDYERAMFGAAGHFLGMDASVDTMLDFMNEAAILSKTLTPKQQGNQVQDWMTQIQAIDGALINSEGLSQEFIAEQEKLREKLIANLMIIGQFGNIRFKSPGMKMWFDMLTGGALNAEKKVKDIDKAVEDLPSSKTVTIRIKQVGGIIQTAMSNVQSAMAESAMNHFNSAWDSRIAGVEAAHEAAANRLDRAQQNAQDAFDERWERRREAIEKAYQKRIDRINREIEAEEKANTVRQRLFEKEMERLKRLADRKNTNIDFNVAVDTGELDEAAKIYNNAQADSLTRQMEDEMRVSEARAEARIKALEKKNERLEKQRDKELKQLQKMEERMRKHLERVQDARRNALQAQQQDVVNSLQEQRDYEEAVLEQRLDLFTAYTARNQRDLERWMREVGLSYDDFGSDVKAKGEEWSSYFRKELAAQIRQAGTEVMNDNIWETVGRKMAEKLLKGLGFKDLAAFNRFVRTGQKGGGEGGKGGEPETRHDGGVVGSGGGSRGSIPNAYKGLHRSEKMIRAQKGEYVVNKNSAKDNLRLLEAINKGSDVPLGGIGDMIPDGGSIRSNGYGGPAAVVSAAVANMFLKGAEKSFHNAYQVGLQKQRERNRTTDGKFNGAAGIYSGMHFDAEQMRNAATIASVGSNMGMTVRDLQIGIMTSITESMLRNVNYGDRDSLGLFQQRPSQGWGSPAQVTNPKYAAGKFFSVLKGVTSRTSMSPWMVAQTVQRSAYPDGSNYQQYWDEAQAIFNKGLKKQRGKGGGSKGGGYVPGGGGKHRPIAYGVSNGLHGGSTAGNPPAVDMAGPTGAKVYAVTSGRIAESRDIAGPLSTDTYNGDGPYGSFGRMIRLVTDGGASVLYAHLSRRSVSAGQRVDGGAVIGYSGNTGNSSGPHLHFGATNGPYAWLRRGGKIRHDNTPVIAHKDETMLSARLTRQFEDNVAGGSGSQYHVILDLRGAVIKEELDIEKAVHKAIDAKESRLGRKRVVK